VLLSILHQRIHPDLPTFRVRISRTSEGEEGFA
jgi:hypothetical protein